MFCFTAYTTHIPGMRGSLTPNGIRVQKNGYFTGSTCTYFDMRCWKARYTPHTSHYTLHTSHYILHTTYFTLHTTHDTLYTTHYTLHTTHFTLHTSHDTLHTTHYTLQHVQACITHTHYNMMCHPCGHRQSVAPERAQTSAATETAAPREAGDVQACHKHTHYGINLTIHGCVHQTKVLESSGSPRTSTADTLSAEHFRKSRHFGGPARNQ
jgi:hypothetical protein